MAVYEIRPGVPFAYAEADKVTIVGSGSIWADDDTATYASAHSIHSPSSIETITGIIAAPLPAVPSAILAAVNDSMGFLATASLANTEGAARQITFYVGALDDFPDLVAEANPSVSPLGVQTLDYASFAPFILTESVATALANGDAHLFFAGPGVTDLTDTADGTLYDFTLRINYAAPSSPPPLRRYPRADGLGIGPTRHHPRTRGGVRGIR